MQDSTQQKHRTEFTNLPWHRPHTYTHSPAPPPSSPQNKMKHLQCHAMMNNHRIAAIKRTAVKSGFFDSSVRVTKSGSVLPLYKISVLLKTGGAIVFIVTRKINIVRKAAFEHSNDSIDSVVVNGRDFVFGGGGSNRSTVLFFLNFFFISFSFYLIFFLYFVLIWIFLIENLPKYS